MFKGDRSLQMHIETLMLHIIEEVTASSVFDVLICDRSAIDYLAYANLRFDKQKDSALYETISATVSSYSSVYEKIFILSSTPEFKAYGNFRSGENTSSTNVSDECLRLCKNLGAQFEHVALEPSAERSSYVLGKILNCLTA
ncbi:hypothetical protein [Candidatus Methylobacter oryzae]|uniref:NadR/Ttd14 AAA domain-containing protein n=1 Tax=Candidatus Methylobacter oryzae TaxID=2497749 RepID=A0ABY3CD09_9GAMM|nr:hypothetical protein [Candidatus Methylobacter oryzae]TRW94406.1 hypothetical protein EKO24_011700 [Candidatus Methylobacter oryzae]